MYRLLPELAALLIEKASPPEMAELGKAGETPFQLKNKHAIGLIDPISVIGIELDYLLEIPYALISQVSVNEISLNGFWLYRTSELEKPNEPIYVPKVLADPNAKDSSDPLDVSDCSIYVPSDVDKLTCQTISTLEKLLMLEPNIKQCLKNKKEEKDENTP